MRAHDGCLNDAGGCLLRSESRDADEVEKVSESSSSESVGMEKQNTSCNCSDCFLHVPQYSQRAYLQIVRVRFL